MIAFHFFSVPYMSEAVLNRFLAVPYAYEIIFVRTAPAK